MDVLRTILEDKSVEVADARRRVPLATIRQQAANVQGIRDFKRALEKPPIAIIAEIKKASPSKGTLTEKFDHLELAMQYQAGGAHALSVLTDKKYFHGDKTFIEDIKDLTHLPILRKDFIIDEYQVYESRVLGADALLLIVRALSKAQLKELYQCAKATGLAVLVEAHSEEELEVANEIGAEIIGINNRDLVTFAVNLEQSVRLRPLIRKGALAISESGIFTVTDVRSLKNAGFKAVLVGEGLIRHADRSAAVRSIIPD
ncbi:MAG: indole-3-glycerol phosphate synthase TrpC [Ignavibacteriales bacterium]|nr:indole-3-glycerol phosphate synthase TrpC [Ignavibacteriales bacterium]